MTSAAKLTVRLTLSTREVLTGEAFKAQVELANATQSTLRIAAPASVVAPPLDYEFASEPNGAPVYTLSRQRFHDFLAGDDPLPLEEPKWFDLAAGKSVTIEEEPGQYAVGGIAPGSYFVRARWTEADLEAVSDPVELRVSAPQPTRVASLLCPASEHVNAILAEPTTSGTAILERNVESPTPDGAVAARVHFVAAPHTVTDVAAAVHAEAALRGRWHGWLCDEELSCARTWGDAVMANPPSFTAALSQPKFARPLVHWPDESASWVLFASDGGQLVVQGGSADARTLRGSKPEALGTPFPSEVKTRAFLTTRAVALFWVSQEAEESTLQSAVLNHTGQVKAPLHTLWTTTAEVLAWNVGAVGAIATAHVHLLCRARDDGALCCVSVSWSGTVSTVSVPHLVEPAAPLEAPLLPPSLLQPSLLQPSQWVVSAPFEGGTRGKPARVWLGALLDKQLWVAPAAKPSWQVALDEPDLAVSELHFLSSEDQTWLAWLQAGHGLRFQPIG